MKKKFKALLPTCSVLCIVLSFVGCDKDFSTVDSDVIGEGNANFDAPNITIPVTAYNKKLDSVQISNLGPSLLGIFNDPVYGQSKASIVTQIKQAANSPDFGANPVIDSVVLRIPYYSKVTGANTETGETLYALDSLYGNPEAKFKISIYRNNYFLRSFNPNASLNELQRYYSNANIADKTINSALTENTAIDFDAQKGDLIFEVDDFKPSNKEIILTTGTGDTKTTEIIEPSFRVHLDNDFWKAAIIDQAGSSVLSNDNNFYNYFRGLYIKAEPIDNDGSMVLLNLADAKSNIIIYYSKDSGTDSSGRIQTTHTFNFTGNKLNTFINDFDVTLQNGNKTDGDDLLYLKNIGSIAVVDLFGNEDLDDNKVPDALDALRAEFKNGESQNALINEAQLIVYEDENITSPSENYHKYDRIYAYDINNNTPLIDYAIDQTTDVNNPLISKFIHLGRRAETGESTNVWKYKIRITQHLNNLVFKDSTNTKIGLVISNNVNNINNALILNSGDGVTSVPAASIISPRGTVLHGSNQTVNENRRMALKIFFTKPK
tara:strand:+ start:106495 stop:108138 length:1644 start_codon:yes stop_codon:yes gene_type:complete